MNLQKPLSQPKPTPALTGIKDVDLLIMSNMDDQTLLSFCITNKNANNICDDQEFWKKRFISNFGNDFGDTKISPSNWKANYLEVLKFSDMHPVDAILENQDSPLFNIFMRRLIDNQILLKMKQHLDGNLDSLVGDEEITLEQKKIIFNREVKKLKKASEEMFHVYWEDGDLNELKNPEEDWYKEFLDDIDYSI